jgi:hypothetical protein
VPEFVDLTEAHLRSSFGLTASINRAEWLARHHQLATRIATAFPVGRRWRGRLNPISWVGVS